MLLVSNVIYADSLWKQALDKNTNGRKKLVMSENEHPSCRKFALAYRDLSENGNSKEAAANVFNTLRWSETVDGAKRVYFPEINADDSLPDALVLAVKDRLTRAASGVVIENLI